MVAIKNSFLLVASLAALSIAFPGSGQWEKPNSAPSGVTDGAQGGTRDGVRPVPTETYGSSTDHGDVKASSWAIANAGEHKRAPDIAEHDENEDDTPDPRFPHFNAEVKDDKGNIHYKRTTQLGVYECMNQNFVLPCIWTPLTDSECHNRNYGSTGSMGPDKGLTCIIYEQPNCNDKGWNKILGYVYPGFKNYQDSSLLIAHGMSDDGPISIRCTYDSLHPSS